MSFCTVPLVPRSPGPLRVLIIGRISTPHQNIENIDASYRYDEEYLQRIHSGPTEIKHLGEPGSGLRTDRLTIVEAEEEIATETWDLVLTEDLARFYRNPRHQYVFVQDAVDYGTRVICIGDQIDTADENWEVAMGAACLRHGLHIPDTRRRVRRTATYAFHHGGMVQTVRFGYRKLTREEAQSGAFGPPGLRMAKVAEHTPVIREMRDRVLRGELYEDVADWLHDREVRAGPYVRSGRWTGQLVASFLRDPILHGTRTFRDVLHQPIFKTGKYRRQRNPSGPETEHYPDLAHLTEEEHRELLAHMDARKDEHPSSAKRGRAAPRQGRARSQSLWPGQHLRCAACNGLFYWSFQGQLKCQNSYARVTKPCWCHVQVAAEQVRAKVLPWLLVELGRHPGFRTALEESAWEEYERTLHRGERTDRSEAERIAELEKRADNLAHAIAEGGQMPTLLKSLREVEETLEDARRKRAERRGRQEGGPRPASREEFAARLDEGVLELARTSFAFAALLRRVLPRFVIQPVQALDSGLVRPRARVTLRPAALADARPDARSEDWRPGDIEAVFDLFEPPEHIRCLRACVALKAAKPELTLQEMGTELGIGHMSVKRALDYAKLMNGHGLTDPYRELAAEPERASRWRKRRGA